MKPDAFGYSWWYKTLIKPLTDPLIETPVHPDAVETGVIKAVKKLTAILKQEEG